MLSGLVHFCVILSLAMPVMMVMSVWMGIVGWGCPGSSRAMQSGQACLAFWKRVPSSASAVLDSTDLMIWHRMSIGFSGGARSVQLVAAWETCSESGTQQHGNGGYKVLLCIHSTMPLAWMVASGCIVQ